MKLTIERDLFVAALGAASRISKNATAIPILSNVLLSPADNTLRVRATDLDYLIENSLPAEIQINGANNHEITAPAQKLHAVCDGLKAGAQIQLEWEPSTGPLVIRSGRSRYSLHTLPATDFPSLPWPEKVKPFKLPGKELAEALATISFAIGQDKSRPFTHGVNWQVDDRRIALATTNGGELALVRIDCPDGVQFPSVIVPEKAVAEIGRLAKASEHISISLVKGKIAVTAGTSSMVSKLIDATFPDYRPLLAMERPNSFIVDVADFAGAVTRLRALDDDTRMRLNLESGLLTISLVNPRHGDADEKLDVEYEGPSIDLGVKASGVQEILGSIDTARCAFKFADPRTPFIIVPTEGDGRVFMTSPVNVPVG